MSDKTANTVFTVVMAAVGAFLAYAVVMVFVTWHAETRETAICETKGGIYIERTCVDPNAVIKLEGE